LGNKQIAAVTGLSVNTVQAHIIQAAERTAIEGPHSPRLKLTIWFLSQPEDDLAA
jgi:DNA-binding NarL/FixJ family response regulator